MESTTKRIPTILIEDNTFNGWGFGGDGWDFDKRGNDGLNEGWTLKNLECKVDGMPTVLRREITEQTSGVIHTEMSYCIENGENFYIRFFNDNADLFKIIQKADGFYLDGAKIFPIKYGKHYIKFITDLDKGFFEIISDSNYIGKFRFTGDADSLKYISCGYDKEGKGKSGLYYLTKMYKDYYLYDHNIVVWGNALPYEYSAKTLGKAKAYLEQTGDFYLDYSYSLEAKKDSEVTLERYFDRTSGNITFDIKYICWDKNGKLKIGLYDNDSPAIELLDCGEELFVEQGSLRKHIFNVWQQIRVYINFTDKTATVYSNGKKQTVISLVNIDLTSVNNLKVNLVPTKAKSTKASVAEIFVFDTLPEPEDYVPEPIVPKKRGDYYVGMNSCPIWRPGTHAGWDAIAPYPHAVPIAGLFDEGSLEATDWEIKFMAEHGIDFQLSCWYDERVSRKPMRMIPQSDMIHKGHFYAKYSNYLKFALLWCPGITSKKCFREIIIPLWLDYYFSDERYMRVDNKAVVSMFGASALRALGTDEEIKAELEYLRNEVKKLGYDDIIYMYCDVKTSEQLVKWGFDAAQAYSWGRIGYDPDITKRLNMKNFESGIGHMVPTVSAGFNAVPWHGTRTPNTTPEDMQDCLEWVRDEYLPKCEKNSWKSKLVMMSTWNEFGEGTFICPAGLNGFGYLDAIRNVFCEDVPHTDVFPSENQKKRINIMHPIGRSNLGRLDDLKIDLSSLKKMYEFNFKSEKDLKGWEFTRFSSIEVKDGKLFGVSDEDDPFMSFEFPKPIDVDKIYYVTAKVNAYKPVRSMCMSKAYLRSADVDNWEKPFFIGECYTDPDKSILMSFRPYAETGLKGKISHFRFDPIWAKGGFELESITIYEAPKHPSFYIDDEVYNMPVFCEVEGDEAFMCFAPKDKLARRKDLYFEWDNRQKKLLLFGKNDAVITVGSDIALLNGKEVKLPKKVEMNDGMPMIPVSIYAKVVECDYKITKDEIKLYSK